MPLLLFAVQLHNRSVKYEEGKDWADQRGFLYRETSAKNRSNVEAVFDCLVERVLQQPDMWSRQTEEAGGGHQVLRTLIDQKARSNTQCCA